MSSPNPAAAGNSRLGFAAIVDTLPLAIAVVPWGILTGAIAMEIGLTPLQGQLMSLLVFAGAAQLSAMTLMAGGVALGPLYGSTFVISARHLLYSVVFREHVLNLPLRWRVPIGFLLTDEMFAISQVHTLKTGRFSPAYALISGFTFYLVWNAATLIGILIGDAFADLDAIGLDFAIVATFIAMTFDQLRRLPVCVAVVISGVSAVFLKPIWPDSYIIFASLLGMGGAYLCSSEDKS